MLLHSNCGFLLPPHIQEHVCGDTILNSSPLLPYSHSLVGGRGVSHRMTLLICTESYPSWMTGFLLGQMWITVSGHHRIRTLVRSTIIPLHHDSSCISRLSCHCLPKYSHSCEKSHTVVATLNQSSFLCTESICLQPVRQAEMHTLCK